MIRVLADQEICIGGENCTRYAPTTFRTYDGGKVDVLSNSTDSEEAIKRAVDACPVAALPIDDDHPTWGAA